MLKQQCQCTEGTYALQRKLQNMAVIDIRLCPCCATCCCCVWLQGQTVWRTLTNTLEILTTCCTVSVLPTQRVMLPISKNIASSSKPTRHRTSTSMYSLTFRVRVATPAQYGRNGTASLQITSHMQQPRRFYRWCLRSACGVRWAWRITAGLCHSFP